MPRPRLLPAVSIARGDRALFQHLRAAPVERLRYGHTEHGSAGAPGRPHPRVRRRPADALLLADSRQAEGHVFNAGTDEEVTVHELAKRIKRLCHSDSPIELVPYEEVYGQSFEDMRRRVPDLKKIRRFVGYRPQVSLDRLLETTIRDHCERMGVPCPI